MELKVLCDCGQKYAFDVEPVSGQMPFVVNCPGCGKDGTSAANALLTDAAEAAPQKAAGGIRLSISQPPPAPAQTHVFAQPAAPLFTPELRSSPAPRQWEKADMAELHSMGLGFLGAFLGAVLGVGIMFGWLMVVGFVFPVVGLLIGALTGFGARLLYKGTDVPLGVMAAVVAFFATGATFLILFGIFAVMSFMVLMISVAIAYKIAG